MKLQTSLTQAIGKSELNRTPEWKYFISLGVFPQRKQVSVSRKAAESFLMLLAPEKSLISAADPFFICPGILAKMEPSGTDAMTCSFWCSTEFAFSAECLMSRLLPLGLSKAA